MLQNQATCMIIKQNEKKKNEEIEDLKKRILGVMTSETELKKKVHYLETEIVDKNKVWFLNKKFYFYLGMK